jgi:hypothetical protein
MEASIVVHACNPSTEGPQVQGHPGIYNEVSQKPKKNEQDEFVETDVFIRLEH